MRLIGMSRAYLVRCFSLLVADAAVVLSDQVTIETFALLSDHGLHELVR